MQGKDPAGQEYMMSWTDLPYDNNPFRYLLLNGRRMSEFSLFH